MSEAALLKSRSPDLAPEVKQRQASDPSSSVWVNASAGSGKTTILTQRVTRLLLDGVKPERILCITYTRAAAAQMALRVMEMLSDWATCGDNALGASIEKLQGTFAKPEQMIRARRLFAQVLSCPGGMRIRTIHAFCQEILRRFPLEAGLPPHFAVIEESDARALQDEVLDDLLRDEANNEALKLLVCDLGEGGFREAMRSMLSDRAQVEAAITKHAGLKNLLQLIRAEFKLADSETAESIIGRAVDFSALPHVDVRQAAKWLLQGSAKYIQRAESMLGWLDLSPADRTAQFDTYCDCFFTAKGEIFADLANVNLLKQYPDLDPLLRREAERLQKICAQLDALRMAETTSAVLTLGTELISRYTQRKNLQAVLEYDDLIIRTDQLLKKPGIAPWVLYKLDGGLDHILVDEAQDTSRAQWGIVEALAEEFFAGSGARSDTHRTLFVVGDEKQSIFSFQHADPEAFTEMRRIFTKRITDAEQDYREVPLHMSFRSAPAILQAVDHVFAETRARAGVSVGPIEHDAYHKEKVGRVEVWPLMKPPEKEVEEAGPWPLPLGYEKEHDTQAELAATIADKIKNWLRDKAVLPGYNQPITAGDIMILLRRRGRFADLMVRALKERNIAVTGVDRMCLVKQLPVMDLLALMQFTLLPEDDLNLATVLRGPLLGLSEDDLMALAIGRKGTLWQSLIENKAFKTAHDYLADWLKEADFITPFAMLVKLLNTPCPANKISGRQAIWSRLGPDALDPIDELLNAAQSFSRRHTPSLQSFLHWLMATETEIKRELDYGGGQVRIMTVHAAKGLEAPIVFLPDTTDLPMAQKMPKLLWDRKDLPFYIARKPSGGTPLALWSEARQKQMEEYRRLFYVALTRAENQLYIGGWEPERKRADAEDCWYNLAAAGLQKLHMPSAVLADEPQPAIAFVDPELRKVEITTAPALEQKKIHLPKWIFAPATSEPSQQKSMAPSNLVPPAAATPDSAYVRGRIIHRLLQSLPEMSAAQRETATERFLANPQHALTKDQQQEIKKEVMALLTHPDYAPLFGPNSRAEVPLAGHYKNLPIAGQVDRLCVTEDAVWIVDYKTNRPPPQDAADVAEAYRQQLASYRAVLQAIYPGKTIRCFLLWTYGARLMELPESLLTRP